MKRVLSIAFAIISVICLSFAFGGCSKKQIIEVEDKNQFYTLKQSYNNGWLNKSDLKSIACCYYDWYKVENPYSGLYEEPTDELSTEVENEIKRIYIEKTVGDPELPIDDVKIRKYFGTYNCNIVFSINSDFVCIDPIVEKELKIGGVIFKNFWQGEILVYHIS